MNPSDDADRAIGLVSGQIRALHDILETHGTSPQLLDTLSRWKDRTTRVLAGNVSTEEADRFCRVSLRFDSVSPQSFRAMLDRQLASLQALVTELEQHPDEILGPVRSEFRAPVGRIERVFISHAAADRPIAQRLADAIQRMLPSAAVFMASRPGHIDTGEEWWPRIQRELRQADAYVILFTPASVGRPWVIFECGAAWMSNQSMLTVSARGLDRGVVPEPLKYFQITSLEDGGELREAFRPWQLELADPDSLAREFTEIARELETVPLDGWEGLDHEGRYFAWDGPELYKLVDRDPEPTPAGLPEALRAAGWEPSYGLPNKLESAFARGRKRVFETDRKEWRRAILGSHGEQILLVHKV